MDDEYFQNEYYSALKQCANRYRAMLVNFLDTKTTDTIVDQIALLEFIEEFAAGIESRLPLMKLNRWLGYIQGLLIERGLTTVKAERDWTRPLFRPLDFS